MITATLDLLDGDTLQKCNVLNIEVYPLKNSKRNTIAFTSHNRRRREFEIVFCSPDIFRISTRFVGYRTVFTDYSDNIETYADPDGRRKSFSVEINGESEVNELIVAMLCKGYTDTPQIELI